MEGIKLICLACRWWRGAWGELIHVLCCVWTVTKQTNKKETDRQTVRQRERISRQISSSSPFQQFITPLHTKSYGMHIPFAHVNSNEVHFAAIERKRKTTTLKYYCQLNSHRKRDLEPGLTEHCITCLLYTSPSPRDISLSRMPSSA